MKAGRNDPCPCGSGKKYKKCCLAKDQEASSRRTAVIPPPPSSCRPRPVPSSHRASEACRAEPHRHAPRKLRHLPRRWIQSPREREPLAGVRVSERRGPGRCLPQDPGRRRGDDGRHGLRDAQHPSRGRREERRPDARFAECVGALRERRPEVFDQSAHYYLSWCLRDALAEGRQEVVPSLARELAARAGRDIDTFNRAREVLAYHGQLDVLVEALRIAWPLVKSSDNVVPWGISEFAEKGVNHEIFDYLEHTASPDPADAGLARPRPFLHRGAARGLSARIHRRPDGNVRAGVAGGRLRPEAATEKNAATIGMTRRRKDRPQTRVRSICAG